MVLCFFGFFFSRPPAEKKLERGDTGTMSEARGERAPLSPDCNKGAIQKPFYGFTQSAFQAVVGKLNFFLHT